MSDQPSIVLHVTPPSHPCIAARVAIERKGLDYELVEFPPGKHSEEMATLYGEERKTVPGMTVDGEQIHGSSAIFERLEALAPEPTLYPEPIADAVRAAERWGNEELQDLGRRMPWGALYFRPEAMGTFAPGGSPLDPAGTDFAMRFVRSTWRYHGISAELIASDLAGLPEKLDHIDSLAADGIVGGDELTAADLQIGSTILVLLTVGDLLPLIEGRSAEAIARRWFPDYPGTVPAGAFPAGWVPERETATAG